MLLSYLHQYGSDTELREDNTQVFFGGDYLVADLKFKQISAPGGRASALNFKCFTFQLLSISSLAYVLHLGTHFSMILTSLGLFRCSGF